SSATTSDAPIQPCVPTRFCSPCQALVGVVVCLPRRADVRSVAREAPPRGLVLLVRLVLVAQAAHQLAARARDPQGISGQVVCFGHAHRHRFEAGEEGGAAQFAAARADTAVPAGFVACGEPVDFLPTAEAGGFQPVTGSGFLFHRAAPPRKTPGPVLPALRRRFTSPPARRRGCYVRR